MSLIEIDPSRSGAHIESKSDNWTRNAVPKSNIWIECGPASKVSIDRIVGSLDSKPFQFGVKRAMDIGGSIVALLMLSPLLLAVVLAVKATSRGPVFFKQERWGKNLRKIRVYKFRTMYWDQCDISGVEQTKENDSRITPVGAVLRKYNMDELPQLLNILLGDMSMVGPRCHAVGMKASGMLYEQLVPEYHLRHMVTPGLTGLAQVRGLRGPTVRASKARARVAADLHYIENYSVLLDIKIMLKTILGSKGTLGF